MRIFDEHDRLAEARKVSTSLASLDQVGCLCTVQEITTLEIRLADTSVELNKLRDAAESLNRVSQDFQATRIIFDPLLQDCVRLQEQLSEAEKQRNAAIDEVAMTKQKHDSVVGQLLASEQELQAVKGQLSAMESRLIQMQKVVQRKMSDAELQTEYLDDTGLIETRNVDRREMSDAELQTEYSDETVQLGLRLAERERVIAELRHGNEAKENKYHALRGRFLM